MEPSLRKTAPPTAEACASAGEQDPAARCPDGADEVVEPVERSALVGEMIDMVERDYRVAAGCGPEVLSQRLARVAV